jgi:tetratricopeptide (TPR) repeat protein
VERPLGPPESGPLPATTQKRARSFFFVGQEKRQLDGILYLKRVVSFDLNEKRAWNYLGIALQDQGDLKEAEPYYRKALNVDPEYTPALQNLEQAGRLLGE